MDMLRMVHIMIKRSTSLTNHLKGDPYAYCDTLGYSR
jgi:hypothetical protein